MTDAIDAFAERHHLPSSVTQGLRSLVQSLALSDSWPGTAHTQDVNGPGARDAQPQISLDPRYEDLGLIGTGGMAEVRRVRDRQLQRTVAMKTLSSTLAHTPTSLQRFIDEAKASSQLQHPNIVPVYDLGVHADGRPWFTMREVHGRTLTAVIDEVHRASTNAWSVGAQGFSLRRLVSSFVTICRAVAYAHERGVVHRDLKPDNVMIGALRQIYVLDWGIAKILEPVLSDDDVSLGKGVVGTPAFMPPEQARGELANVGIRSDIYALGATLYAILAGHAPYRGLRARAVLGRVIAGPPPDLHSLLGPALPPELVRVCERAMHRQPEERYPSAKAFAADVEAWLDGARRRTQALEMTTAALAGVAASTSLREQAQALRLESASLLASVQPWQPEELKADGWARADEADEADRLAALRQVEVDQGLYGALRIAPDLPEAHAALLHRLQARHAEAESERKQGAMARHELALAPHLAALPTEHPAHANCVAYLRGDGALTLLSDPPGANVQLFRYTLHNRRLVEVFERDLGATPLRAVPLPMGSYMAVLRHPNCEPVRYPIDVPRQGHWDGVRPGDSAPTPIWLPPANSLAAHHVYVPAGWFHSGGDPLTYRSHPARRLWCDALITHRFQITNRQYIEFLDDLVKYGKEDEALMHAPRTRAGSAGAMGDLLYGRTPSGGFEVQVDADGDLWSLEWPVFHLAWQGAVAYCAWLAARTGSPWRLAGELEWEKAARGVDGRWFAWGDHLDPSWCNMLKSQPDRASPQDVDTFPTDVSPYGVRGVGGNMRDWCADAEALVADHLVMPPDPALLAGEPLRTVRGGSWFDNLRNARLANRDRNETGFRVPLNGIRPMFRPT